MAVDEIEIIHHDGADPGQAPRRPATLLVLVVLAVAALLAAVLVSATGGDDGDVDVAVDEEDGERPEAVDRDSMPVPIALGGPTDGKDSAGLPVKVDPATGLTNGQTVTVTGTGFPPNQEVGVVMCTKEAGRDHGGRGAEACNLGRFAQATSSSDGIVVVEFQVQRLLQLDGQEVDCASEADRCLVGMGLLSDYDQSGGAVVSFDSDEPLPPQPTSSVSKSTGLADGEEVELRLTGLLPGSSPGYEVCDASRSRCGGQSGVLPAADEDGVMTAPIRVWRSFGVYAVQDGASGNLDCALEPCSLQLYAESAGGRVLPPIELRFDPGAEAPAPPTATLLAEGPFAPGSTIPIEVTGLAGDVQVDAMICNPAGGECWGGGGAASDDDRARIELPVPPELRYAGGACGECRIVFTTYPRVDPGGLRPPLNPDPLSVTITG